MSVIKVFVAFLNYKHGKYAQEVFKANADKAGYKFDYLEINEHGIANAINHGLRAAFEHNDYDACMVMANDILEDPDWLKTRIEHLAPNIGLVSAQEGMIPNRVIETTIIGNWLIPRHTFEAVGYFNTWYDQHGYGPIDLDYCQRVQLAGLKTIYAKGISCKHLDNGDGAYGFSKQERLKTGAWDYYKTSTAYYQKGGSLNIDWESYPNI